MSEEYAKDNPDSIELIQNMKESLADQVNLVQEGLILHVEKMDTAMKGLHDKMEEMFQSMKISIEEYVFYF